jgi:4-hydroxy-4-methyl-2-oxoglutarate aldolase
MSPEPRVAQLADALDALGHRGQCLGWDITPLDPSMRVAGRAFPLRCEPVAGRPAERYTGLLEALAAIGGGDVAVLATGRSTTVAVWGELLSAACRGAGVAGMVTDGLVRDSAAIRELGFPAFARGTIPLDIHGRLEVTAHGVTVEVDGVAIAAGDTIVGDADGVVVIPQQVAAEVFQRAAEKAGGEREFRAAIAGGESLADAFARIGVL